MKKKVLIISSSMRPDSNSHALCEEVAKGVEAAGGEAQVVRLLGKKIFRETADWLDSYFAGRPPAKLPRHRIDGLTPFREMVVEEMLKIPFGKTVSYGDIAARIAKRRLARRLWRRN